MTLINRFSLQHKNILVTGGTGVLGAAFIKGITEAGGGVGVIGRNKEIAAERVEDIQAKGGKAIALVADVLNEKELEQAREKALAYFGKIDGLVNAAGGIQPEGVVQPGDDLFKMNLEGIKKTQELNLWGTVLPTQVFGAAIAASGGGSIVNISSMNSKRAITKVLGYNLGKAGVDCYTQWFAVELAQRYGDKVRMNALAPGFFLTEQNKNLLTQPDGSFTERGGAVIHQTPFKRFGEPNELIGALVWLLSDASKFVTGSMICVDGGFSAFGGV